MDTKHVSCPVEALEATFGVYANAFRIIPGGGKDLFLDFCVYSVQDDKAKVVARVRVGPEFLKVITDRISADTRVSEMCFILPGPTGEN